MSLTSFLLIILPLSLFTYTLLNDPCFFITKLGIVCILVLIYILYNFLKSNGYLPKKSVKDSHIFITGGGSGKPKNHNFQKYSQESGDK